MSDSATNEPYKMTAIDTLLVAGMSIVVLAIVMAVGLWWLKRQNR